jgi:TrpR-related protein YerC/YecD
MGLSGHGRTADKLADAVLTIKSREDAQHFFEDLCTIQEIQSMEQRMHVAILLHKGHTFSKISEATGASTATISRVNRSLRYGAGGYEIVLRQLNVNEDDT